MQRTKIDFATHVWNPVSGCYGPGGSAEHPKRCFYCYAQRMAHRLRGRCGYPADDPFRPTWHPERFEEPFFVKKPSRIFVCSMGELFAEGQDDWVRVVLRMVKTCSWHTFLFLTKNPEQLQRWNPWPQNAWVGASATDAGEFIAAHKGLIRVNAKVKFISFEPLLGNIVYPGWPLRVPLAEYADWVIIGAMTGPQAREHRPRSEWVEGIVQAARAANVPLFVKNNMRQDFLGLVCQQEFPDV